jgi:hypothetical protein
MSKAWPIVILLFITVVSKAQYLPGFPQRINLPEYINPGHFALQKDPAINLHWGNQFDDYGIRNNVLNGLLSYNVNIPVSAWNTTFGATFLGESYGNYTKINSNVHSGVKVQVLEALNIAMGLSMGMESNDKTENETETFFGFNNSYYASSGLVLLYNSVQMGTALHFTQLHPNGVFNGKNFSYFIDGSCKFRLDEITSLKPAFIYSYYSGSSNLELGISASFNKLVTTGIAYRFQQAIMLYSDIELFKVITFGLGYFYNYKETEYLSNGITEVYLRLRLKRS